MNECWTLPNDVPREPHPRRRPRNRTDRGAPRFPWVRIRRAGRGVPRAEPGAEAAIERIERDAGTLPLAIKLFWRRVGSVNFIGEHAGWDGCEYPDPLVVYPPSVAVSELEKFLADREERMRCRVPYRVPVAPDRYKANVSGGMCYNLSVPAVADDPPLNDERHRTTFVNYLELAVRWGAFPGLDRCPEHNWPLADLVRERRMEADSRQTATSPSTDTLRSVPR